MKAKYGNKLEEKLMRLTAAVAPGPSIVEAVMQRIEKTSVAQTGLDLAARIVSSALSRRVAVAAAAVASLLIGYSLLPAGRSRNIAWADVIERISQAKTMVSWRGGNSSGGLTRVFMKDPGLLREEEYDQVASSQSSVPQAPSLSFVTISPVLDTDFDSAGWTPAAKSGWRQRAIGCPRSDPRSLAQACWTSLREISADKTRRIGQASLDGTPTVIFEAPVREFLRHVPVPPDMIGTGRVWVDASTGAPVQVEVRYCEHGDAQERIELLSGIQWDLPVPDDLFRMPRFDEGGTVTDVLTTCLSNQVLKAGITVRLGPREGPCLATEMDVERVAHGEASVTMPGGAARRKVTLTFTAAAAGRIHAYTGTHVGCRIILDFNGEVENDIPIVAPLSTGIACDITSLGKSIEDFEQEYLTSPP